jgi:hypothetical protein
MIEEKIIQHTECCGSSFRAEPKRRGIIHKDFAEESSNMSGILNGRRKIPVARISVVSGILSVPVSVIL